MNNVLKCLMIVVLGVSGAQCGKNAGTQGDGAIDKCGGDTIMLACSPGGATYLATLSENNFVISGKRNRQDMGLSIYFYSYKNKFSVSHLSGNGGDAPFMLYIGSSSAGGDGCLRPGMYFYDDYAYPTDTVVDVKGDILGWHSAIGKCFIVDYWPNAMCRSDGFFLYNEHYEIGGGLSIGIHRKHDEHGSLTDVVDTDTLDLCERLR